mgnify:CR=1 FL=1
MTPKPDISFVTVNFNGIIHTLDLLKSIVNNLPECNYEIIVVDNGSKVNEAVSIKELFPKAQVIRSDKNLGFAGGNNLGIKSSAGRYIFLINNDAFLIDDSVTRLIDIMDRNKSVAAVSPKIYFVNPENTIQFAGYTHLTRITIRNSGIGYNEQDTGQYNDAAPTSSAHGAAMMVRREVIEKIGLMSEDYFLYYEEIDWCEKMKEAGFELWYRPEAIVIHKESQSTGSDSFLKRYYITRNRLLFASRHRKGVVRAISILYQLLIADWKDFFKYLLRGRKDLSRAVFTGARDFILLRTGPYGRHKL